MTRGDVKISWSDIKTRWKYSWILYHNILFALKSGGLLTEVDLGQLQHPRWSALKSICNIKNCYWYCDYCDFTTDTILELENKKVVAWSQWMEMGKLTNSIKINNHKLKEHTKPIKIPKAEPSAKIANNQEPLIVFEKRFVQDVWRILN